MPLPHQHLRRRWQQLPPTYPTRPTAAGPTLCAFPAGVRRCHGALPFFRLSARFVSADEVSLPGAGDARAASFH